MALDSGAAAPSPASSTSSSVTGAANNTIVNASRLRENQRRSRARKKEYLLSLEARFQACQRIGIEANIEIQNAAKKVVRENLILRGMLKMRGVTDGEINKTLKEGGEGSLNGETAVEGVLKVLGKRPCGGEPITGGASKSTGAPRGGVGTERRNSTGMVAARDADRGGAKELRAGPPTLAVATSKFPSQSLLQPQHTPSNYLTPTATPTTSTSNYAIPPSPAPMGNFYSYGVSSPQSYASPIASNQSPTYNSYQMSPTTSSGCCPQPQASFYPATQSQCSPSPIATSSCCPPQRPMYPTAVTSSPGCSYQTTPVQSTTPCHLAQSYINQLHPGLPGESNNHLVDQICPRGIMENSQCHVDNSILFGILDRI